MARMNPPRRQAGLSMVVIILLVLGMVLLLAGGTVGVLFATGVLGDEPDVVAGDEAAAEVVEEPPSPPVYLPLEPVLVVNLQGEGSSAYLQAGVEVMARGEEVISALQEHMPVVRNNLLLLLGSQSYADIDDRQGKDRLRERAREEINRVLTEQGLQGEVEAVYFTSFVVQ